MARYSMPPRHLPTPDEIRAACREFQRTWSPLTRLLRSYGIDVDDSFLYATGRADRLPHDVRSFSPGCLSGRVRR